MRPLALAACLALAAVSAQALTFNITTNGDAGPGSLRDAILTVNSSAPPNTITCQFSPSRIIPLTPLPAITNAVTLDGTNNANYLTVPIVALDGQFLAGNSPALTLQGTGIVIRAISFNGFSGTAVNVSGNDNTIEGCWITSNTQYGVTVSGSRNTVGGPSNALRNVIFGNGGAGVVVAGGADNRLLANWIGLRPSGVGSTHGLPSQPRGVWLPAGTGTRLEGATNATLILSLCSNAVEIGSGAYSTTVRGGWFGLDGAGTGQFANINGIVVYGPSYGNLIGGPAGEDRNTIAGNSNTAIALLSGASNNTVAGNTIGLAVNGFGLYTNQYGIALIDAPDNIIGTPDGTNSIGNCAVVGIQVTGSGATRNLIQHNIVGTSESFAGLFRCGVGLLLSSAPDNQVGPGNVLVTSLGPGLEVVGGASAGTRILGNFIGVSPLGSQLPNQGNGVAIDEAPRCEVGDGTVTGRNVIAGNFGYGLVISATGAHHTVVAGNWIGVAGAGIARTNRLGGIWIYEAASNSIGVAGGERNVISGNDGDGVWILGSNAIGNVVANNFIGLDPAGTSAVLNTANGVNLQYASRNRIGGTNASERNVISGNEGYGILVQAGGAFSNRIAGNYIGGRSNGFVAVSNQLGGVRIESWGALVGGASSNARNVIIGNGGNGITIAGPEASNAVVQNNYIGILASGGAFSGNGGDGVNLAGGSTFALVGGAGAGNIIGGNGGSGVQIAGITTLHHRVAGNWIGLRPNGTNIAPNQRSGIYARATQDHTLGGQAAGEGNVIAGNVHQGIEVSTSTLIRIYGNRIGVDVSGTVDLGNATNGILILASSACTIGGPGAFDGNQVSGNGQFGIWLLLATNTLVQGNLVGLAADGLGNLGNAGNGIFISGISNMIGGINAGEGNRIGWAVNPLASGITISLGSGTTPLLGNVIFSNTFLAIDLEGDGPTANDPAPDTDTGVNLRQNYPIITNASPPGTTLSGYLPSSNSTTYRLEFFAADLAQGGVFLGATSVTTSASGTGQFAVAFNYLLSTSALLFATATDPAGRTSEYSPGITNRAAVDADGDGMPDAWEQQEFGTTTNGAGGDVDGDGLNNLAEYITDTHPTNGASFFDISGLARGDTTTVVQLQPSAGGRFHQLEYTTNLVAGAGWLSIGSSLAGNGGLLSLPDNTPATSRHYRVRVGLP